MFIFIYIYLIIKLSYKYLFYYFNLLQITKNIKYYLFNFKNI